MAERAIAELGGVRNLVSAGRCRSRPSRARPGAAEHAAAAAGRRSSRARTAAGVQDRRKVATRKAYGDALVALGARDRQVVALDGEVSNSTYADEFAQAFPERYFEMFIAEQQMVAAATGLAVRGYKRVRVDVRRVLHPGLRLHPDGRHLRRRPAAGRIARGRRDRRRRPVPDGAGGPGDDARRARVDRAVPERRHQHGGARRRRWPTRPASATCAPPAALTRCCTRPGETFHVGGSKMLRSGSDDQVTLIGAGVTLHECLRAAEILRREGIAARVIDCYSVKPVDTETLAAAAEATGGRIVVAEDHHPEGGLGSAVADALLAAGQQDLQPHPPRGPRDAGLGHRRGTARLGQDRRRAHRRRGTKAGQRVTSAIRTSRAAGPWAPGLGFSLVAGDFDAVAHNRARRGTARRTTTTNGPGRSARRSLPAHAPGDWSVVLIGYEPVPRGWFPAELAGVAVLCLASGGGQQGPVLAAAGAAVTVFDNSPRQLGRDIGRGRPGEAGHPYRPGRHARSEHVSRMPASMSSSTPSRTCSVQSSRRCGRSRSACCGRAGPCLPDS